MGITSSWVKMRKLGNTIWTKILDCPPNLSHCLKLRAALLTMRKKWCKSSSGLPRLKVICRILTNSPGI
ncbi:hypothetical protein GDO86_009038 [Hymenochirus boettgeri]|uniref:Uncharacterized protein n=1 Tax=Hymenochirus boettgeri TaxID=247094 RepID=A0A8T2JHD2_9PIPI|nr:hypothetical protein GDO86_009038 [Hymenochirus boettgeri]